MTGRDWVAVILAIGVAAVLVVVSAGVVFADYHVTGEGLLGAIVGAIAVAVVRYLGGNGRAHDGHD